jgi:protease-4
MEVETARSLAEGRVWSGRQALANGLVDANGGLARAIEAAKELAGMPADEQVTLVHYPAKQGLLQSLLAGGDTATVARWAVYRAIREDAAQTWRLVSSQPGLAMDWSGAGD